MALLSIHASVYGGEEAQAKFAPEDALKMAVYYATHPREITLENIQHQTSRKLVLSECAVYGSLKQCTYQPAAVHADEPGLQSLTVSSTTVGASLGGFITWQLPQAPCTSDDTVARFVGKNNFAPGLPPTFYQPPGTPDSVTDPRDHRIYQSKNWDSAARLYTIKAKCIESVLLDAQLSEE
jgi:hypothetical protein